MYTDDSQCGVCASMVESMKSPTEMMTSWISATSYLFRTR